MGAQLRVYRRRIRSVQSTMKITRAMELIATSRIVKAQQRVEQARPYAMRLTAAMEDVARQTGKLVHPLLEERENPSRAADRKPARTARAISVIQEPIAQDLHVKSEIGMVEIDTEPSRRLDRSAETPVHLDRGECVALVTPMRGHAKAVRRSSGSGRAPRARLRRGGEAAARTFFG